ncbi:hypothetical protein NIES3275_71720 (plasmid) [Microchaete diplosiphon NIES-3275]|nr:hypothetical protein NIES3275_71720 [Microchaete diplosiphon NIES-3275]
MWVMTMIFLRSKRSAIAPARGDSNTKAVTRRVKATESTTAAFFPAKLKARRAKPTQVSASPNKLVV